jgi:hypothetical protein
VLCGHLPSILYRFDITSAFVIAENGRKTISAARGRVRPEVKSPFDSLIPIWCTVGRFWNFSTIFYLSKVIRHCRFACKMLFENFGEGIFPVKYFSSMKPPKGTFLEQSASFEISCVQIGSVVWSVGLVTKKGKVRQSIYMLILPLFGEPPLANRL